MVFLCATTELAETTHSVSILVPKRNLTIFVWYYLSSRPKERCSAKRVFLEIFQN